MVIEMKATKKAFIKTNYMEVSIRIEKDVRNELAEADFDTIDEYDNKTCDLIVCIGGDGAVLNLIHELNFPDAPIIGINTGHLGFFQEIEPSQIHEFLTNYANGNYQEQKILFRQLIVLSY